MNQEESALNGLAQDILNRIEKLVLEADADGKPLEIDPARGHLFELFVSAHGAGFLDEDADVDLTADEICKHLGAKWGLAEAAQNSQLQGEHMARMRLLWSVMRMWMEWDYAWSRWDEFQNDDGHIS